MTPTDKNDPRLPEEAEQLLENWPLPERDAGDWEGLAAQIDAQVEITPIGSTEDALLMAPLPEDAADESQPERRSHPRVKRPSDGGLAALAKATMLVRDEIHKTELAQATLDVARRARRTSRDRPLRVAVAAQNAEPVESKPTRLPSRGMWISMSFGVLGIAAALAMYVSTRRQAPVALVPMVVPVEQVASVAPGDEAKPAANQAAPTLPVEEVPLVEPQKSKASTVVARRAATKPAQQPKTTKPAQATKPATPPPAQGPSEAGMVMADGRSGVADRPSPGAIQAAVGSVMGAARACTAGLNGVSRAAVTFGSNGHVQAVAVSGPAAGTGAEACIQTALGRARVQPFARPSYTVRLSVRPE